jgi:acetyltransferase-like isoleucine patch superfamily enzyme
MTDVMKYIGKDVKLGKNVKIWHFSYIGDTSEIGDNTTIGSLVHIDYNVKVGRNCKIEGMTYIPPLTVIGDHVFIGPGVIFTNDPYPASTKMVGVQVESDVVICAGAIVKAGVHIGARSIIGMGSVVTKDVPVETVVFGNPARVRYPSTEYLKKKRAWTET